MLDIYMNLAPSPKGMFTSKFLKLSLFYFLILSKVSNRASLIGQLVKNLPAMQETPVRFLGGENLLEKG